MKRFFDFSLALFLIILFSIPILFIFCLIKLTSNAPAIYWSKRIGKNNKVFNMPKFRSMNIETPELPSDLLVNPKSFITPLGSFLRKTSLDELPQLWCILIGNMSFVGPRPVLSNQNDLINLRTKYGIHNLLPGLTGWAQINGRDNVNTNEKVMLDLYYLNRRTFFFDLIIIIKTIFKVIFSENISH